MMPGLTRSLHRRVLILGDNDMAGLAIIRSLGRAGMEVHLVAFDDRPVARRSRYVHRCYEFPHPQREPEAFCQQLIELVQKVEFDLVIPVSDASLVTLIPKRDELARWTKYASPDETGFHYTNDKGATWNLAKSCGVPVPESVLVNDPTELDRVEVLRKYPLVLKPTRSVTPGRTKRFQVRLANSMDAVKQWLPEMVSHSPVLVQDFFPGQGIGVCVLGDRGQIIAAFQHLRVHEPPQGGASSYRQSVPLDGTLLAGVKRMCAEMVWTGPAMFEFKQNPETKESVLIEINGRFWGSLALATFAGVDFPNLLYDLLVLDKRQLVMEYRVPVYARFLRQEPYWLLANLKAPSGRPDVIKRPWSSVLGEIRNLFTGRETWDVESVQDPVPMFVSWRESAKEVCSDIRSRFHSWHSRRRFRRDVLHLRSKPFLLLDRLGHAKRILVMCHGNINRSAIAGARLRQLFADSTSVPDVVLAGFVRDVGRPTSPISCDLARELGVDLADHRSQGIDLPSLERADVIVVMDSRNLSDVEKLSSSAARKVVPLAAFDKDDNPEIPDPYGETADVFRQTYRRIIACTDRLAQCWREAHGMSSASSGNGRLHK